MFRIDLQTGEIVTPTGKKSQQTVHFIEAQLQEFDFAFVNYREIQTLPEGAQLTMVGDVSENNNLPMFIARGELSEDRRSVHFSVNTYTQEYCQRVRCSSTKCFVDIYIQLPNEEYDRRLVRFHALADARLYVDNLPPQPLSQYYSKEEIDRLLAEINVTNALPFGQPGCTTTTLPPGEEAQVQLSLQNINNQNILNFDFALPAGIPGATGPAGAPGHAPIPVERIYYHETYGLVSYLDANNSVRALGYYAEPWHQIKLWMCSLDNTSSGNIVLRCQNNQLIAPVAPQPQLVNWVLTEPVSGLVEITRLTTDSADTLQTSDNAKVTALLVDWRIG